MHGSAGAAAEQSLKTGDLDAVAEHEAYKRLPFSLKMNEAFAISTRSPTSLGKALAASMLRRTLTRPPQVNQPSASEPRSSVTDSFPLMLLSDPGSTMDTSSDLAPRVAGPVAD